MNRRETVKKYDELNKRIIENQENKVLLATSTCMGEGFEDVSLEVLFLTFQISGINRIIKKHAGRLHRTKENKKEIIIYDYIDDIFLQTRNMFFKRKKLMLKWDMK